MVKKSKPTTSLESNRFEKKPRYKENTGYKSTKIKNYKRGDQISHEQDSIDNDHSFSKDISTSASNMHQNILKTPSTFAKRILTHRNSQHGGVKGTKLSTLPDEPLAQVRIK